MVEGGFVEGGLMWDMRKVPKGGGGPARGAGG